MFAADLPASRTRPMAAPRRPGSVGGLPDPDRLAQLNLTRLEP